MDVGPEQVALLTFLTSVDQSGARNIASRIAFVWPTGARKVHVAEALPASSAP
jgi:hypothetical protein